jgi:EAL and modified HD-GYP domain-containing signal transduction protein
METQSTAVMATRQPLFDARRRAIGYEIRSESPVSGVQAHAMAEGRQVFVPIDVEQLLTWQVEDLVPEQVVLQLPGSIEPTPDVREACETLRRRGFRIALDRFTPGDDVSPLLRYVDYLTTEVPNARRVIERPMPTVRATRQPAIVAVDVSSEEARTEAEALGCSAFQGEFIVKPKLTATSNIEASHVTHMRLMRALQDPDLSVIELEELIKPDAALCLRVMRSVNGAAYGQQTRITSLRQALLLVGVGTVREWATVWALTHFSNTAPAELVVMAAVRGRFCELLSRGSIADTGGDGFLLGMCSLLDAILDSPMERVLDHLPLCESNDAALRGTANGQRALLDAAIAYEFGHWTDSRRLAAGIGVDPTLLPAAYNGALSWMARFQELAKAA